MDIASSYRLLELKSTASLEDVKASYRRLARRWHPDVNPDDQQAQDMFIRVTQAYQTLLRIMPTKPSPPQDTASPQQTEAPSVGVKVAVRRATTQTEQATETASAQAATQAPAPPTATVPVETPLSVADAQLKRSSFQQLQDFMATQRFPRAIALVEALGQRLPQDKEVRQWQAIVYQRWARTLISERKFNQARAYLKKALNTDPHNRSLWAEVERDFRRLEQVF